MAKTDWKDADGTVATVARQDGRYGPTFTVVFTYKVDEEWYGGTFTGSEEYAVGDSIAVRYDPAHPDRNDLVQKETRKHWIVGILIAFAVLAFILAHLF